MQGRTSITDFRNQLSALFEEFPEIYKELKRLFFVTEEGEML
jgi:hypothetical protein